MSDIDQTLLSFCDKRWLKVARIAGKTIEVFEKRGVSVAGLAVQIDERVAALVASGQIEAKGDIRRWGYSEIRLPP